MPVLPLIVVLFKRPSLSIFDMVGVVLPRSLAASVQETRMSLLFISFHRSSCAVNRSILALSGMERLIVSISPFFFNGDVEHGVVSPVLDD